jgi:hypothetical protein
VAAETVVNMQAPARRTSNLLMICLPRILSADLSVLTLVPDVTGGKCGVALGG